MLINRAGEAGVGEDVPESTQFRKQLQGSTVGRPVGLASRELDSLAYKDLTAGWDNLCFPTMCLCGTSHNSEVHHVPVMNGTCC